MTEAEVREILGSDIKPNGNLACTGRYLYWQFGHDFACLDADFSADELEAIAWWMKNAKSLVKPIS